nr:probable protein phosphatase 2C 33 [Tanacetum cinerariifolium]
MEESKVVVQAVLIIIWKFKLVVLRYLHLWSCLLDEDMRSMILPCTDMTKFGIAICSVALEWNNSNSSSTGGGRVGCTTVALECLLSIVRALRMGSCLSGESRSPRPSSPASGGGRKRKSSRKRTSRNSSFNLHREDHLHRVPGRLFLNGSSEVASLFTQQGKKGTNQDAMIVWELTIDLKPNLPAEADRIRKCKGRVFALLDEPDVTRVWLPNNDSPGLAMARAFGDFCLKDFGLISVPDIFYRRLTENDQFVVLATDGV